MGKGITRERTGTLLRTLFMVLADAPEGLPAWQAIESVATRVSMTEHESGEYENGGRRFDRILRFATVDAQKAGWLNKANGIWTVTDAGRIALRSFGDAGDFYREACRLYAIWRRGKPDIVDAPELETTQRDAAVTFEQAMDQASTEIADHLASMDPYQLQDLVAALMEAMGYHINWISPPGKDGGLDIVAFADPLGTKPPRIKVQVKRRKDAIGTEELRSFLALIGDGDVGIFVTTGSFSRDSNELARSQERRRVTLIDQALLVNLWIEYQDKISPLKRAVLPLKPIYFLAPSSD
jgi:restriction system protein